MNDWYSQCIPAASTSTVSTTTTTTTTATSTTTGTGPSASANYWFSFGDSYTQTGFVANSTLPAVGNPLGNPPYPGYTATGGENWIDFDTTTYNKSLVFTYNYAYGGATIDATLVPPYTPTVQSVTDQVNIFLNSVANKPASTPWTSSNSLFSVWIGINDIGNTYYQSGDRNAFNDQLISALFALIQKLYNVGARNFLFINVPPIDRSPLMLSQGSSATAAEKAVITSYNTKLAAQMNAFKAANGGVKTWLWDSNAYFTTVLNNPTAYGFQDATSYGTGSNIFWGNNYHPGSAANKLFGQQIGQLLNGTVW